LAHHEDLANHEDETRPSLRSIPPIARPSLPPALPESERPSTLIWALGALALACAVAIGVPRFGIGSQRGFGSGADKPEQAEPGPGLRTEVVRDAPLQRMAESQRPDGRRAVAVVPRSAVARMEGRPMVFVADRDLRLLVATPVVLGAIDGEEQRVLSGVSAGQLVVTEGVAMLEKQGRNR
jgi:hypothetical protein